MNKLTLEMELPVDCSDQEQVASHLVEQTNNLVRLWRDILLSYKEKGVTVPTISVRGISAKKSEGAGLEQKAFRTALIDHVLKYQPNIAVPSQIKTIQQLYALDSNTDYWISLFESSHKEYPLTTWHTVKYKLSKETKTTEPGFDRKELSESEIEEIRNRVKEYTN
jgi:hypothetical protein